MKDVPQHEEPVSLLGLVSAALKDGAGVSETDAERLARGMCRYIAARYSGRRVYVAAEASALRGDIRDRIRAEFNGRNLIELMARYGVSKRTVYRYASKNK